MEFTRRPFFKTLASIIQCDEQKIRECFKNPNDSQKQVSMDIVIYEARVSSWQIMMKNKPRECFLNYNPLEFWKEMSNSVEQPAKSLYPLARKYLVILPSSASTERRFSWASSFLTPQRLSTRHDLLKAMLVLLNWYKSGRDIDANVLQKGAQLSPELEQWLINIAQFGSLGRDLQDTMANNEDKLQIGLIQNASTCT